MKKITFIILFIALQSYAQVEVVSNFSWGNKTKVSNKIIFTHSTPEFGAELWVSDGTSAGTMILKDMNIGASSSSPNFLTLIDDVVYFQANTNQIWRTDGTAVGTYAIVSNNQVTNPKNFTKAGQFIFFSEGSAGSSCCHSLWKTLTTPNSESMVTPTTTFVDVDGIATLDDDEVIFNAKTSSGWGIWRSNGVVNELIKDINSGTNSLDIPQMRLPKNIEGTIYFNGFSADFGGELWTSDGTFPETKMIRDIYTLNDNPFSNLSSSSPTKFTKVGTDVYFSARDINYGYEVWKTNGSASGTMMVKDINVGNNANFGPDSFTNVDSLLYFTQGLSENPGTTQIWKTNGTEEGTTAVTTIPGSYLNSIELFYYNGIIYFSLFNPTTGSELWKVDTASDTVSLLADIASGTLSSEPTGFFEYNGFIYFTATSDGTFGGIKTYRIAEQSLSNQAIQKNKVTIFPNPTKDVITIELDNESDFTLEMYNLIGEKVAHFLNQKTIDVSHLTAGIYMLKVKDHESNSVQNFKLIKK
ncbi:T9SS type A sorting domain-containing protein [Flavobacterium sp.]|uniref:T9SS type A sorting domain-containing protein n=1 Tax=Flavobacterium sp. TaxID=239 RepID=UPI002B4B873E|nr:T9SS type A sorting domain-containing protein [Flavobacterium sp.]HLP63245.1 T9SS type A sorting domain-containing protein [Flavobacterium sp.]